MHILLGEKSVIFSIYNLVLGSSIATEKDCEQDRDSDERGFFLQSQKKGTRLFTHSAESKGSEESQPTEEDGIGQGTGSLSCHLPVS